MAGIGKVLSFLRDTFRGSQVADVKVDQGGGDTKTVQHFAPPGDDSQPLPGDYAQTVDAPGRGRESAVGYQDPKNAGKSLAGESRRYARNADGTPVCEVWCKSDGTVVIEVLDGTANVEITTPGAVILNSPDVRLGDAAGQAVARVGDLVAVTVPQLICAAPGSPAVPVPPTAVTATGGYVAAGQIISGSAVAKAE